MSKYLPFWNLYNLMKKMKWKNYCYDFDTEFEYITKDAEEFIMNAESSVTQENVLEAVIYPETMAQNESDCDFVNRNICSHTVSRQQKLNESSNSLKPIKEPKVCSREINTKVTKGKTGEITSTTRRKD